MTDQEAAPTPDVLDVLVDQLLACGAPVSQMMATMQEAEASGLSSPDAPPIFEVAHSLIRSVVDDLTERYSDDEIRVASAIVAEAAVAICENVFLPAAVRDPALASRVGFGWVTQARATTVRAQEGIDRLCRRHAMPRPRPPPNAHQVPPRTGQRGRTQAVYYRDAGT